MHCTVVSCLIQSHINHPHVGSLGAKKFLATMCLGDRKICLPNSRRLGIKNVPCFFEVFMARLLDVVNFPMARENLRSNVHCVGISLSKCSTQSVLGDG